MRAHDRVDALARDLEPLASERCPDLAHTPRRARLAIEHLARVAVLPHLLAGLPHLLGADVMTTRDVDVQELRTSRHSGQDFGLVVGVDHYPRFRSLQGAAADAAAFHAWMCDPDGGGVAPEHARLVTSTPEPPTPLQDHIDEQVVELVQTADALGGGRRLYMYFSGHGATCTAGAADDVALLLAKWSPTLARLALSSQRYCSALGSLGLFEEIAMFLDCCRTAVVGAVGMPPAFTCKPANRGAAARTFVAYASEVGRPAFEQSREGEWHGTFTRRLLWILRRSPHGIEAAALKQTLERELREDARQRAHVVNGLRAGSSFGRRGTPPMLEVKPDDEWDTLELFDGVGQMIASHHPADGTWTVPLAPGLYKLICSVNGKRPHIVIDHGVKSRTSLDFRPRLSESVVHVWNASIADRWVPPRGRMQLFTLSTSEPLYIGTTSECAIQAEGKVEGAYASIRNEDGIFVIEDLGSSCRTLFHGRISHIHGSKLSGHGKRIRTRQLHDGDLFRCGALRLLVGYVQDRDYSGRAFGKDSPAHSNLHPQVESACLLLHADSDVSITVYDALGAVCARGEKDLEVRLLHGLYRLEAELFGRTTSRVIELERDVTYELERPEISTPAVGVADAQGRPALAYSIGTTSSALGPAPHSSSLLVVFRLWLPRPSPSELVSVHDEDGHLLAEISQFLEPLRYGRSPLRRLMSFSCEVATGRYCLRAPGSRRNVTITIPAGYAARVFVSDRGSVHFDDMRVSLAPASTTLNDHFEIGRAMESVIAALPSPERRLSARARALLRTSVSEDLCFGMAAAHVLARTEDHAALEEVLDALAPYTSVPDIAILRHAYAPRAADDQPAWTAPPLLRASLQLMMTHSAFDLRDVPAKGSLATAACSGYANSVWCTWSHCIEDQHWIAPTIAELRHREPDAVALARTLGIPPSSVRQVLKDLGPARVNELETGLV